MSWLEGTNQASVSISGSFGLFPEEHRVDLFRMSAGDRKLPYQEPPGPEMTRFFSVLLRPAACHLYSEADGGIHEQLPYEQPPGNEIPSGFLPASCVRLLPVSISGPTLLCTGSFLLPSWPFCSLSRSMRR